MFNFRLCLLYSMVQKEYIIAKPAKDAAARAKMAVEELVEPECLHVDNEWNIR